MAFKRKARFRDLSIPSGLKRTSGPIATERLLTRMCPPVVINP